MLKEVSTLLPESYWLQTGHRADYPKLEDNMEIEVAVIGAGIAGILSAYQLIKAGKKVAVFERFRIINGTTGNTTAKLSAQHGLIYAKLVERYGKETAKLYYQANMRGIKEIKNICRELKLGNLVDNETLYAYTTDPAKVPSFKKEKEVYDLLGIKGEYLEKTPIGFDIQAAVSMLDQGIFHPVEFLNGVLAHDAMHGLKVYENTLINKVDQLADKSFILKDPEGHEVKCKHVVLATHYPLVEKDSFYDQNLWARTTQTLAYKTNEKLFDGAHIAYDTPSVTLRTMEYFGDHYFLIGGQSHGTGDGYSDEERYEQIYKIAEKLFGVTHPAFKWSTHDLMTPDHMPFIGLVYPDMPNIYTITGLNAWGLANASAGALVITDMICGGENLFTAMYDPHRVIKKIPSDDEKEKSSSTVSKVAQATANTLAPDHLCVIHHNKKRIGVYKDKNEKVHYMDIACTHLGCDLGLNDGDKTWDCPCHGSRFDKFGRVIYGPAIPDLPKLDVK